jgi:hypothetical protein
VLTILGTTFTRDDLSRYSCVQHNTLSSLKPHVSCSQWLLNKSYEHDPWSALCNYAESFCRLSSADLQLEAQPRSEVPMQFPTARPLLSGMPIPTIVWTSLVDISVSPLCSHIKLRICQSCWEPVIPGVRRKRERSENGLLSCFLYTGFIEILQGWSPFRDTGASVQHRQLTKLWLQWRAERERVLVKLSGFQNIVSWGSCCGYMWASTHVLASFAFLSGHAKQINRWPIIATPLMFSFLDARHWFWTFSSVASDSSPQTPLRFNKTLLVDDPNLVHFSLSRSHLGMASCFCDVTASFEPNLDAYSNYFIFSSQ